MGALRLEGRGVRDSGQVTLTLTLTPSPNSGEVLPPRTGSEVEGRHRVEVVDQPELTWGDAGRCREILGDTMGGGV